MSIMSNVTITPSGRAAYVHKLKELIGARKPEDALWILMALVVETINRIKGAHERRRMGAQFIRELDLLAALGDQASPEDDEIDYGTEEDRLGEEPGQLISQLVDDCVLYSYGAFLAGFSGAVEEILRHFPKEPDRNRVVLETITASAALRSDAVSRRIRTTIQDFDAMLKPVGAAVAHMPDHKVRQALILEIIDAVARLNEDG
jgi:hypothetical protein